MCPFSTDTDPNRFRYDNACALSSGAPAPLRIDRPQRDVSEDDDGRAALEALDVFLEPLELFLAEAAETARLQIDDVDEPDEVHAAFVEALPAGAMRAFTESLQIALAIVAEHVVLARHVEHRDGEIREHLLARVELRRLG
jgi:hypothetical protein